MQRIRQELPDTDRTMHVVNHIRALIENGTLDPGDKIPPEREFANSLRSAERACALASATWLQWAS